MIGKCNNYSGRTCNMHCKDCKFFEWIDDSNSSNFVEQKNNPYKPPLGVEPKNIWKLKRLKDLSNAIKRYVEETLKGTPLEIPKEWIEEYNDLVWDSYGEDK